MKIKKTIDVALIISVIVFIGSSVDMIIRNFRHKGFEAAIPVTILGLIVAFLIFGAINIKKKWLGAVCGILLIAIFVFAGYQSTFSSNKDAMLAFFIYVIACVLIVLFGILRHKIRNKSN